MTMLPGFPLNKPCKHVKAGEPHNGTGLCWACGANHRAAQSLTDMDKAFKIFNDLRRQRD